MRAIEKQKQNKHFNRHSQIIRVAHRTYGQSILVLNSRRIDALECQAVLRFNVLLIT